jgi:hypothetical protein
MKMLIIPLAGIGMLAAAGAVQAASPAYCALYAREYANLFTEAAGQKQGSEQHIQDEAYYHCLNQDEDPQLPRTSAYFGTELDAPAVGGPLEPLTDSATASTTDAPAKAATDAKSAKPAGTQQADATPGKRRRGSGKEPWTPEWLAWCKDHFPNSFDEKTGMIVPYKTNNEQFCD